MEKYYRFAGLDWMVSIPEDRMYADDRTLSPFRVPGVSDPHSFIFSFPEMLTPPEGKCTARMADFHVYRNGDTQLRYLGNVKDGWNHAYLRAEHRGQVHKVEIKASACGEKVGTKAVLSAMQVEHLLARAGGFVLHASYVLWKDRAILFTAPSGTGKSTQAELWRRHRSARIINGDRAAVRIEEGTAVAEGLPFAGSSGICENYTAPLAAVVYLTQAPETKVSRLRGAQAFRRVWEGISVNTWDKEDLDLVSGTVTKLLAQVPVYYLACTPDESAVAALEECLRR